MKGSPIKMMRDYLRDTAWFVSFVIIALVYLRSQATPNPVVPFDGEKFDADSGGTVVTGLIGRNGGKHPGDLAGKDIDAGIVDGTVRKGTVDLSGRIIGNNGMPKSGIYMVQTADGRRIKKVFNFGN